MDAQANGRSGGGLSNVEQQYAEAFAAVDRGTQLSESTDGDVLEAVANFQTALRILNRLAIVESAAKRQLLKDAIEGINERVQVLEATSAYCLAKAMEEHAHARQKEQEEALAACIELYITAGDWYMKALTAFPIEDTASRAAVKEQLEYIIDYTSQLKARQQHHGATTTTLDYQPLAASSVSAVQSTSTTATTALDAFDWPEPPKATEAKMTAITPVYGSAALPSLQTNSPPLENKSSALTTQKPMRAGAAYTPEELDVLRRSSLINGHLFLPWVDDLDSQEPFSLPALFEDPDGFVPLSAKQYKKDAVWMRPSEYALICKSPPVMIASISPQVVKQDIVTDCSFVASLCISAAYELRFHKRLITNIIYPVDPITNQPIYNPFGKYVVKLWANGVPRKVVIDDYLPVSSITGQLLSSCTTQKNELWVTLIEKAYLKLNGGYDFPGGNSGIDLFALTGWIPERIAVTDLLNNPHKEERLWEQMKSAFHYGDCIITMSTGDIGRDKAKAIGLVPMHVYAVLNVYELTDSNNKNQNTRLLQVKNPWRKMSWKGPFSNHDTTRWESAIGDELRAYQQQFYGLKNGKDEWIGADKNEDDGLFWIDLESVKKYFESLYLNWNPALFPYKDVYHQHWPVELGPSNDSITLGFNPQYSLTFTRRSKLTSSPATSSCTVWVLLSRHVSTVERDVDLTNQQFLTLHVYRGVPGKRIFYNHKALWRGTYSNNPHTLVSLDVDFVDDPEPSFTLVASQYEKFAPLDYTLSIFSTTPFVCSAIPQVMNKFANCVVIEGAWDAVCAGGRPFYSTFMNNPQYHIQIQAPCQQIYFFLEGEHFLAKDASSKSFPMNLRVVLNTHERQCVLPSAIDPTQPCRVISSGEYRPGFCFIELTAEDLASTRDLVLIPSTFKRGSIGKYTLRIVNDSKFSNAIAYREIPQEGAGMELTRIMGKWDAQIGSAAGCSNYGCYTFNPKYLLYISQECYVFVRLLLTANPNGDDVAGTEAKGILVTPPSINVSIFESTSRGDVLLSTNPKRAFREASSECGVYVSGNPSGVVTKCVRFPAGSYVVIPSTFDPQEHHFELRIYSSVKVSVRCI